MAKIYRINEVFYSLQGEGYHAGRAAVFIRFSGCNLRCPFCDTDFTASREMTIGELLQTIQPWKHCQFIVLTGGEPTLQTDEELLDVLHSNGWKTIAMETNGTHVVPNGVDWITVSPKCDFVSNAIPRQLKASELKVVFDGQHPVATHGVRADHYYLQPCDTGNVAKNQQILQRCVAYIQQHPQWHLSLQQHKIINIR